MVTTPVVNGETPQIITIGTRVEVHNTLLQTWSRGFRVAAIIGDGYLIRRLADGHILPRCFTADAIRPC